VSQAVEAGDLALALDPGWVTLGQAADQRPDAVADVGREVRGRGTHELTHVLDRRVALEAAGLFELAHDLKILRAL